MLLMDNCYDNVVTENFGATLITERIHDSACTSRSKVQTDIFRYIQGF